MFQLALIVIGCWSLCSLPGNNANNTGLTDQVLACQDNVIVKFGIERLLRQERNFYIDDTDDDGVIEYSDLLTEIERSDVNGDGVWTYEEAQTDPDHVNNPDNGNDELKVEQNVVRRRRTDRKRASVKTKLWRKSMMERRVLPPPPLPLDNTAETDTSNMSDYTERSHHNQDDGAVSYSFSVNTDISPRDTAISSIDNQISLPENTGSATETPRLSDTRNKTATNPASHLDKNIQSSDENKWMTRKRLSPMRRQCLPPPPAMTDLGLGVMGGRQGPEGLGGPWLHANKL